MPQLPQDNQERNLRLLTVVTLLVLISLLGVVCWWLYEGVGYFQDEMSFSWSYGPRKGPRIPLPAGTVPWDGMGYDRAQLGQGAMTVTYNPRLGAQLYGDQCEFCHAASGRGDTPVGIEYDPQPPDLNQIVPQRSDEQLYDAITNGMTTPSIATSPPIGPLWHAFRLYLNEADRRQLVDYLRQTYGQGRNPTQPPATTIAEPAHHIVGNPPARTPGEASR